jgi:hypothetical protein
MGVSREEAARAKEKAQQSYQQNQRAGSHRNKPNGVTPPLKLNELCLSPAEWEARDIEPEDTYSGRSRPRAGPN